MCTHAYVNECMCMCACGGGAREHAHRSRDSQEIGLIKGGGLKNQTRVRLGAVESHAALCPQMGPKGSI